MKYSSCALRLKRVLLWRVLLLWGDVLELFRAFVDWFEARAKNPILGYFLVAQIFLHWQDYALLIWSEEPFQNRMIAFRAQNGVWELVAQPVAMAFCFAMILPFIAFGVSLATQWAVSEHRSLKAKQLFEPNKRRLDHETELQKLQVEKQKAVAEAVKIAQDIRDNYGSDVVDSVTESLGSPTKEADEKEPLTNAQIALLKVLEANNGVVDFRELETGNVVFTELGHEDSARTIIELIDAAAELKKRGMVRISNFGEVATITANGYAALDDIRTH